MCVPCHLYNQCHGMMLQALQEARSRSDAAGAEVQRINKEVARLELAIPKLQLEAAAARHQSADLQHRLAQLSQAAQVTLSTCLNAFRQLSCCHAWTAVQMAYACPSCTDATCTAIVSPQECHACSVCITSTPALLQVLSVCVLICLTICLPACLAVRCPFVCAHQAGQSASRELAGRCDRRTGCTMLYIQWQEVCYVNTESYMKCPEPYS